ncbi:unnamed protein product [Vitrella brassicaformis CCMP3155]|uniref:Rgp1-domain-containing protein n=1 Tax=Vitrella brassicaformis (strain CCMP3155) TaxID=1169540 RepID=A0A0G4FJH5_VITBC|nr:unnamed protein product [Vitrella brassicaformis CCMP3155]|eukprot:CEM13777.1 unnamed protein product [Vitrella brassicaformis CCMP3155]
MAEKTPVHLEVLLSQPGYFAGDVLRCNIILHQLSDVAVSLDARLVNLDYLMVQLCGQVTDPRLANMGLPRTHQVKGSTLYNPEDPYMTLSSGDGIGGGVSGVGSSSNLLFVSDPCVVCSDLNLAHMEANEARWFGFECLIPPFIPPSFSGTHTKYSYYLLLTCQKRSPRRVETMNPYLLSSHQSTAKVPVMIMGPRCNDLPLLPTLGPLILPDQDAARRRKGPLRPSPSSPSNLPALAASAPPQPIPIKSTTSTASSAARSVSSPAAPPAAATAASGGGSPNGTMSSPRLRHLGFDFQSRAWEGGGSHSQISMLKGVGCGRGVWHAYNYNAHHPPATLEANYALWQSSHSIRRHGPALLHVLHPLAPQDTHPATAAMKGRSRTSRSDDTDTDSLHGAPVRSASAGLLNGYEGGGGGGGGERGGGVHPGRRRSSIFDEDDDDQEPSAPTVLSYRVSRSGVPVCVIQILSSDAATGKSPFLPAGGRSHPSVHLGAPIEINLDFSIAQVSIYEVSVSLIRVERSESDLPPAFLKDPSTKGSSGQAGRPPTPKGSPTVHRLVLMEEGQCVIHQLATQMTVYVPPTCPPTFETDMVSVSYALRFRFVSPGDEPQAMIGEDGDLAADRASTRPFPPSIRASDLVEFEWEIDVLVTPPPALPPVSTDRLSAYDPPQLLDGQEGGVELYSLKCNAALLGVDLQRMHRALLL